MKDEIGVEVTPERIDELEQNFMFRSDTAARDVGLILKAQQAEITRLRAALDDVASRGTDGPCWCPWEPKNDRHTAPCLRTRRLLASVRPTSQAI